MEKLHDWYQCYWDIKCIRNGEVVWTDYGRNALTNEGELLILKTMFVDSALNPSGYYVRLCNDTLLETDTLTTVLNEPTGNGYAATAVEHSAVGFPTETTVDGHSTLVSKEITFTASGGDIGPVTTAFLSTTSDNTGTLISYRALALSRTILDGDQTVITLTLVLH